MRDNADKIIKINRIRFGGKTDVPGLKRLWKESFGDEDVYIDRFFERLYRQDNVLLEEKDGMLLGASFFLPGRILTKQGWQEIRYVYALAVYPKYRGQKIATKLLDEAVKRYRTPLLTEPADEGLAERFCEPYGFKRCFYLDRISISGGESEKGGEPFWNSFAEVGKWSVHSVEAAQYAALRQKFFQKQGFVEWPLSHIEFALSEHRRQAGEAVLAREKATGREEMLLYAVDDGGVIITETSLSDVEAAEKLPGILYAIAESDSEKRVALECRKAVIKCKSMDMRGQERLKSGALDEYSQRIFMEKGLKVTRSKQMIGMAYGIEPACGYMNLTLD